MKGLYIHIPFCRSKCPYCDFYSAGYDSNLSGSYCYALKNEMETNRRTAEFTSTSDLKFDTVYFGGGTPSVIGGNTLADLLKAVKKCYDVTPDAEITAECNPSTVDSEFFKIIANAGFNRISLGMQSAVDSERRALGRTADRQKVEIAVQKARENGIKNISVDIMTGIPKQTMESLDETIDFCLGLEIPHISAYMLTIEENTVFYKRRNALDLPDEDAVCDMYLHLASRFEKQGIMQYEISNFSIPGMESKHNLKYWQCKEYLGLGPGAHSFINGKRFFFPRNTNSFIDGSSAVFDSMGGDEKEYIMLSMRLSTGLSIPEYEKRYKKPINAHTKKVADFYNSKKLIVLSNNSIKLTKEGFLLSNNIIRELIDY